jgi:REP element-mobilizing transposase RayT
MARPLRLEFPGALYHLTSRGNERRPTFYDDGDRVAFLDFLGQTVRRFGWIVTAWVLMTNHFHLVVQTPDPNLSKGMHWLNTKYVGWFNKRHKRSGHLYGGRFKSHLVEKEAYLAEVLRYVVLNPVRAGMVAHPADYRWSSYRATAGLEVADEWLDVEAALSLFAPDHDIAQGYYREFVEAKIGSTERLWDKAINGIYLGTVSWASAIVRLRLPFAYSKLPF